MRFTCERDDLYKAVQAVSGVVASKGVHPVYESVQIVAESGGAESGGEGAGGSLTLMATDLEIGMRVHLAPEKGLTVEQAGTAVVPASRLASICRELPRGPVAFAWDAERRESKLEAGRSRFHLQGQSPDDFPEIPGVGDAQGVEISAGALRSMVRRVAFAAAKERMRYALNGILLHVEGDSVEMVATDGRRLARDVGVCSNPDGIEIHAIVPTKGFQQLDRALDSDDQVVTLAVGNNHFGGRTSGVTVVSRLVEGSFPPHKDVIPGACECRAVIDRASLGAALKRVSLVTTRDAQSVRFQFGEDGLTVSAKSSEGSAEETLSCDFTGGEEVIGFNPGFFSDVLGVLHEEAVSFEWNGKSSPGKIVEGSYTYVVMPVSLE